MIPPFHLSRPAPLQKPHHAEPVEGEPLKHSFSFAAWVRGRLRAVRNKLANVFLRALYRHPVFVTSGKSSVVAGSVVFWYMHGTQCQYLMLKEVPPSPKVPAGSLPSGETDDLVLPKLRFVSVIDDGSFRNLSDALLTNIHKTLGSVFFRTLNTKLLSLDRVVAAPVFDRFDPVTGLKQNLQTLVWTVQITKEQAELCSARHKHLVPVILPEVGLMGPEVADSHKVIFHAALRHVHGHPVRDVSALLDVLNDVTAPKMPENKTIH